MSRETKSRHYKNEKVRISYSSSLELYRADVDVGGNSPVTFIDKNLSGLDRLIDFALSPNEGPF